MIPRRTADSRTKAALTVALTLFFCVPYFTLQHLIVFPVRTLPASAIDRAIPFNPSWVWMYQSVYVLLVAVPWMATDRRSLRNYANGFTALSTISFLCFLFIPVRGPRPDQDVSNLMFRALASYDRPLNCFPSLHVGLAVYTMLFGSTIVDSRGGPVIRRLILAVGWVWTALIAFAAIATKQHYAIDLPAGALIAYACHSCILHFTQRSTAHAEARMGLCRSSLSGLVGGGDRSAASSSFAGRSGR
jgi:hypothetical protein